MNKATSLRQLFFFIILLYANSSVAIIMESLLDSIIERDLPTANFSMVVKDPKLQEIIYQHNAHKYLSPASNTKLFPAVVGLSSLGKDYRYRTEVGYNPSHIKNKTLIGNLYIKFSGDPSLKAKHITEMLKALPIKHIKGDIVIDSSNFIKPDIAPGMSYDDLGWYYAARTPAVIINSNAFKVFFEANSKINRPMRVKPQEETYGIKLLNDTHTVTDFLSKTQCSLVLRERAPDTVHISGCWPYSKKQRHEKLAVPDPVWWAKQIIKKKVKEARISFRGNIKEGVFHPRAKVAYTHYSKTLAMMLMHMLYESDNLYADSLAKTIAYEQKHVGSYKEAGLVMKQLIKSRFKLNVDDLKITDGAGTRYNLMTALQIAELLNAAYQDPRIKSPLLNALPLSGIRGSIKDRLKTFGIKGRVYAKTGTMHDISSLAGFIKMPDDRLLIFSMITNNYNGKIEHLKRIEDSLVEAIWRVG